MTEGALSGLLIIDLTHYLAGPYCTNLLAGLGAEVIKVERPGTGDPARRLGPFPQDLPDPEKSGLFLYLNTNKKGITLNLKNPAGKKLLLELVAKADVLVENFAPRVMPSLGLDYASLAKVNPRLVMTSISNFGQSGPYRDYKLTEIVAFALGGLMSSVGHPEREPLKLGGTLAQFAAGASGFTGTLLALHHRDDTGVGQQVDVSIMESAAFMQMHVTIAYAYAREKVERQSAPLLRCRDGYMAHTQMYQERDWPLFCRFLGKPELAEEPRFRESTTRSQHLEELTAAIQPWFEARSKEEAYHAGQALGMTFAYIATMEDLLQSAQYQARGFFQEIDHPKAGRLTYPGRPFQMSHTPWQKGRAPLLGEHNEEVYCGRLGYTKEGLVRLAEAGVI